MIELARTGAPLVCVVGFHSGFVASSPEENRAIRAKILLCHGAEDPIVTAVQRDAFLVEMDEAGIEWQLHLYGGVGHSFTNPDIDGWNLPGFYYHAAADARSWRAMLDFFDENGIRPG
jgi:dienelactone hydrolase